MRLLLDANVLGPLCYKPERHPSIQAWFSRMLTHQTYRPMVAELTDFEVRRGLLHVRSMRGLERLNRLVHTLEYVPLTTAAMRRAAGFWAEARRNGRPTANVHSIDGDAILAAQAFGADAAIVTDNTKHMAHYPVRAIPWRDVD